MNSFDDCYLALKDLRERFGSSIYDAALGKISHERLTVARPEKRKRLSWTRKKTLYAAQAGFCARCKGHFTIGALTDDHIVALAQGGSNEYSNRRLVCGKCNLEKGSADLITESKRGHGTVLEQIG